MKKSGFSKAQIAAILAQYETGQKATGLCPEHGNGKATYTLFIKQII